MHTEKKIWAPVYENTVNALIPEQWAQEALMVLENQCVALNFVHRDFDPLVARFGQTVHAHRPGRFTMKRKWHYDDIVDQDVAVEDVPVVLNQHLYTSFIIRDGEESLTFKSLRDLFLKPALESVAQGIDLMILSQVYRFLPNAVGKLGTALTSDTAVDLETKFNLLKIPAGQRYALITPQQKGQLSKVDKFTDADRIGDDGSAIRDGSLGRLFGSWYVMAPNAPSIAAGNTVTTSALTADAAAGATSLAITAFTSLNGATPGCWLTVAGDMTPQKLTAVNPDTETITISPGLKYACASAAVVTIYTPGTIELTAGYASGWLKPMVLADLTVAPQAGQLISIGTPGAIGAWNVNQYAALQASTTSLLTDIPLTSDRADEDIVGVGPAGNYGLALHPNAIAFVSRPLALPAAGAGAASFVAMYNGLAVRVTITYDGVKQGHRVVIDLLCGIKVLDSNLGIPLLS